MKKGVITHSITSAVALSMLMLPVMPSIGTNVASAAAATSNAVSSLVKLNAASYIQVRDVQLMMQEKGLVAAYTVTIVNNGLTELNLNDYYIRVKGNSSKIFKATLTNSDQSVTTVAAKSSVNLTYFTVVDNQTKASDLSFQVVKWDFSVANYERTLGTIKLPTNSSGKAPAFAAKVMVVDNYKIKGALKQYYVTQDENNSYVTLSFLLENVGSSSVDLSKLNLALQTDSYSVYDVNTTSMATGTLQPHQRKIVTVHSEIPNSVLGKSVSLLLFTKDDTNKVSLAKGAFAVPPLKPVAATPVGLKRNVYIDGKNVTTTAGTAFLNTSDDQTDVTMDFTLNNADTSAIALPDLEFLLRTKDGTEYPLTYTKEENANLLPKIDKTINLTGEIEAAVNSGTTKLIVRTAATDTDSGYVVGTYQLSGSTQQGTVGGAYNYDDYSVQLSSVQRSPQTDSDMLIAQLDIKNTGSSAKAAPNLSGYFLVNGVKVETETKAVSLDNQLSIAPNETYTLIVYTEIPYTTAIDTIKFVLTQPVDEKTSKTLYQFSAQSLSSIPVHQSTEPYEVTGVGHRTSVKLLNSAIYNGDKNNQYFFSELEATNEEVRAAQLTSLGAYVEDDKGVIVPIEVSQLTDKIQPGGKVLLSAWGILTKNFNTANYQLKIGRALTDSAITGATSGSTTGATGAAPSPTDTSTVIVQPVAYNLSSSGSIAVKTDFSDIKIGAYSLNLSSIYGSLSVSGPTVDGAKVNLNYDMTADDTYDVVAGNHKIMFEFVDLDSNSSFTKEVALGSSDNASDQVFTEGTNQNVDVIFSDPAIQEKVQTYKNYKLNIYDVYGDAKLLKASKTFSWFLLDK